MIDRRRVWLEALTFGVVAAVLRLWVLGLPFQLDDYALLERSPFGFGPDGGHVEELTLPDDDGLVATQPRYLFDPVIWASWEVEKLLSGKVLSPTLFHAASCLWHALTAALLLVLLSRLTSPTASRLGTFVFIVHPGATQAVSGVAARPHVGVALFTLLAAILVLRGRGSPGVGSRPNWACWPCPRLPPMESAPGGWVTAWSPTPAG